MRWLDGITNSMDMSLSKLQEIVRTRGSLVYYSPWGRKESDMTEQLNNKTSTLVWVVPQNQPLVTGTTKIECLGQSSHFLPSPST